MEARAIVRNVRMTPRKIKLICDLIRGKDAGEAMAIIMNTPKAACEPMEKLLKSAVANAENNHGMNTDKLFVKEVHVGPGPVMKRVMPRAQGRAYQNPQENLAHHAGSWRERIREGNQWARK